MPRRYGPDEAAVVAARLRIAMGRTVRRMRREADGELTTSGVSLIASLDKIGPATMGDLADVESISRPAITVLVSSLAAKGLIRKGADDADRRLVRASLTAAGRAALARARTRRTAYMHRQLRTLPAEDLAVLDRAARILERLLEEPK